MASDLKTSASAQPKVLISQALGASEDALYTVLAATSIKVMGASLCNTSGSAVTVNVSVFKAGGTAGDGTHRIISGYSLAAHDSLPLSDLLAGHALGPGDAVMGSASTPGVVDMVMSAVVFA